MLSNLTTPFPTKEREHLETIKVRTFRSKRFRHRRCTTSRLGALHHSKPYVRRVLQGLFISAQLGYHFVSSLNQTSLCLLCRSKGLCPLKSGTLSWRCSELHCLLLFESTHSHFRISLRNSSLFLLLS